VDVAVEAGADIVKFQTFKAENVATAQTPKAEYSKSTTDVAESHFEMMRKLELPREMHEELIPYCEERGIIFLSSPFDEESADLLSSMGVEAYKIPSGEITNLPFLTHVARKGKPMIVSSGMSYLGEVEAAVETIGRAGNDQVVLLHCVSNYPADPANINLRAMNTMAGAFGLPVGFSDHTEGIEVPIAAVALGACVVEKHFTLDRGMEGPDHAASLEPGELKSMVSAIRSVESSLGDGVKRPVESEADTAMVARKSIVAGRDIPAGTVLSDEMIAMKRPGTGLPSAMISHILGRPLRKDISADTLITLDMLL
jgi:N-acetylneuraminate synthase